MEVTSGPGVILDLCDRVESLHLLCLAWGMSDSAAPIARGIAGEGISTVDMDGY